MRKTIHVLFVSLVLLSLIVSCDASVNSKIFGSKLNCVVFKGDKSFTLSPVYSNGKALWGMYDGNDFVKGIMEYSTDGKTWTPFKTDEKESATSGKIGDDFVLYVRGKENNVVGDFYGWDIDSQDGMKMEVSGNLMTLLDYENSDSARMGYNENGDHGCFENMFYANDYLISVENLEFPADNLTMCCFYEMFSRCENLEKLPKLPATKMAEGCYKEMFRDCKSLTYEKNKDWEIRVDQTAENWNSYMFTKMFETMQVELTPTGSDVGTYKLKTK